MFVISLHGLDNSRACFSIWIEILESPFIWCTFIAYDEFFLIDMKVKFWCNFLRLYQELIIRKTSVFPTRILTEKFIAFCFCYKNHNCRNWKIEENDLQRTLLSVQNFAQITRCHWKSFNKYVWNSGRIPVRKANGVRFYFQSKWRLSFDAIFAFILRIGHSKNIALALLHYCGSQYYRSLTWNVVVISAFFDCLQFDEISSQIFFFFK